MFLLFQLPGTDIKPCPVSVLWQCIFKALLRIPSSSKIHKMFLCVSLNCVFSPDLFPPGILFAIFHTSVCSCAGFGWFERVRAPSHAAFIVPSSCARFGLSSPGGGDCERRRPPPATSWNCWCCRGCCDGGASWCRSSGNSRLQKQRD